MKRLIIKLIILSCVILAGLGYKSNAREKIPNTTQKFLISQSNPLTKDLVPSSKENLDKDKESLPEIAALQTCLSSLPKPQIFPIPSIHNDSTKPLEQVPSYFLVYSTEGMEDPRLFQEIDRLELIVVRDRDCRILSHSEVKAYARTIMEAYYIEMYPLSEGDLQDIHGIVVNRWERDHYVSGGDQGAPFVLPIVNLWSFTILELGIPDYAPILISDPGYK